jgi:hypothetical protein
MNHRGQYKIQQMAFMIVFLFIFFVLLGVFALNISSAGNVDRFKAFQREKAISAVKVISDMSEFNCDSARSWCLDADKLRVMSTKSSEYSDFFSIASIDVRKIYPKQAQEIKCPASGCNHYVVYDNGQAEQQKYSSFVVICERLGNGIENCELAKLEIGVKI